MKATEVETCVVCGGRTNAWVRGWDDRYRCVDHAPRGPLPFERALAEYLIEGDQGHMSVIHEPCGQEVLLTLRVHVDTLARIARKHTCSPSENPTSPGEQAHP